tara:strand:+ start:2203 stop:2880 length:678 start_codon:yes stop_codon:yes gene_type:complete
MTKPDSKDQKSNTKQNALDMTGLLGLIRAGENAAGEIRFKNRVIAFMLFMNLFLCVLLSIQTGNEPVVRLLGETNDGRIRPLPLLSNPIYNHEEIMDWAGSCIRKIYKLDYIDWQETLNNETYCLSDSSRKAFVQSLKSMGLFEKLNANDQGTMYAVVGQPVLKNSMLGASGYKEWMVDVPYTIYLDGKKRGTIAVVMQMRIRRVSMLWRENGIWVDSYVINTQR